MVRHALVTILLIKIIKITNMMIMIVFMIMLMIMIIVLTFVIIIRLGLGKESKFQVINDQE